MVRIPVPDAAWSAWERYCDALGISVDRGLAILIQRELISVVNGGDGGPVFLNEFEAELAKRQRMLDIRERNLAIREQRLRATRGQRTHPPPLGWQQPPRLDGTILARAAPGRITSAVTAGRCAPGDARCITS